jgi:hypothetical protein
LVAERSQQGISGSIQGKVHAAENTWLRVTSKEYGGHAYMTNAPSPLAREKCGLKYRKLQYRWKKFGWREGERKARLDSKQHARKKNKHASENRKYGHSGIKMPQYLLQDITL